MASKRTSSEIHLSKKTSKKAKGKTNDIDWQSSLEKPIDRLTALYEHSRLTDLIITFPRHSTILKVHRLILAMSSPVFERMLFGPMAESDELELPEDPPEAFKWLMKYIYSGASIFPSVLIAVQVLHLASKYQMQLLFRHCSEFLQKKVNGSNLPLMYDTVSLLGDAEFQQVCSEVLSVSAETVLLSNDIGQFSDESMKRILQQQLNVKSELTVFKGIVKWGSTQVRQPSDTSKSRSSIRQKIEKFLPYVRFLTMELDEFVDNVLPCNILTPEEGIGIMMNIRNVKNFPLPEICSKETKERIYLELQRVYCMRLYDGHEGDSIKGCDEHLHPTSRETMIRGLQVSENIHLKKVILRKSPETHLQNCHIEVTEYLRDLVLGEAKFGKSDQQNSTKITAKFSTPVLLRPGIAYDIWMRGSRSLNRFHDISRIQYKNLSVSGYINCLCWYAEIGFLCPEVSV